MSTANVSQLAVDLLIASLSLKQVGIFDPRDLVPVVGGREDGEEGITTPFECAHVQVIWISLEDTVLIFNSMDSVWQRRGKCCCYSTKISCYEGKLAIITPARKSLMLAAL